MPDLEAAFTQLQDERHVRSRFQAPDMPHHAYRHACTLPRQRLYIDVFQRQARLETDNGTPYIANQDPMILFAVGIQGAPVAHPVVDDGRGEPMNPFGAPGIEQALQLKANGLDDPQRITGIEVALRVPRQEVEQRNTHENLQPYENRRSTLDEFVRRQVPGGGCGAFLGAVVFLGGQFPLDLGEVQRQGFHWLATGAAADTDVGDHHVGQGVDDERHQLAGALGGVTADSDLDLGDRFTAAAVLVDARGRGVDEFGQGELADMRLAGGTLRVADVVGDLHGHVVAVGHDFDLVGIAFQQGVAFDRGAQVENNCIHGVLFLARLAELEGPPGYGGLHGMDQAATGAGNAATRRIEAVSSSSWKCGRRNTVAV